MKKNMEGICVTLHSDRVRVGDRQIIENTFKARPVRTLGKTDRPPTSPGGG